MIRSGRQGKRTLFRRASMALLLAGASFVATLGLVEIVLRVRAPYLVGSHQHPSDIPRDELEDKPQAIEYDPLLGWKFKPHLQVVHQGWEFEVDLRTNSRGFRDAETTYERRDTRKRILLLGDSFGFAYGIEEPFGFPARLEAKLPGVEIVNLSVSAYGTDQELLLYDAEGWKYDVDVVMMALTVSNDFADITKDRSFVLYKPFFELTEGDLTLAGVPPLEPVRSDSIVAVESYASPTPTHDFLDRHSALYAFVFERLSSIDALRVRFEARKLLPPQIDVYSSDQVGILHKTPTAQQEKAWDLMFALLDAWQAGVTEHGAMPVLVLIPSHLQVSEDTWALVAAKHGLSAEQYDPAYPHQRLANYCEKRNLAVIDLLASYREESKKGRRLYFRRDPHWNRYGHEFAAECIAAALKRLGIVED